MLSWKMGPPPPSCPYEDIQQHAINIHKDGEWDGEGDWDAFVFYSWEKKPRVWKSDDNCYTRFFSFFLN